ncbi:MAG: hypothetical protein RLZ98_1893 [Pseudomonadota bacterium]
MAVFQVLTFEGDTFRGEAVTDPEMGDPGRTNEVEPIGVIDIGSNSVRLVVYEGALRAPTPIFNEKILCGLGRNIASTGSLGAASVERALAALRRFHAIARVLQVKTLLPFATAAVRDAANGPDFRARGEEILGTPIQILSGHREAALASNGILMAFANANGIAGDLGGGSLELVDVSAGECNESTTLPLGGLRMLDVTAGRMDEALRYTEQQLDRVPWLKDASAGRPFYAVGGTWRAIAKLHMTHRKYPLRVMQGYTIPTPQIVSFCEMLRRKKPSANPALRSVARARREVLPFGALVMERLLLRLKPTQLVFSVHGVREGLLYDLLPKHEQERDPLLSFAADYARLRSRSDRHAHELCAWTDRIFQEPGPAETAEERRLRHAACLLSDIGWRAHPDYRGEQSLSVVAHSGMAGIDHPGRVFLALVVYFRHTGPGIASAGELPSQLMALIDKGALARARIIAAAIRTAHMLSIGRPGIIDETRLSYENRSLVLTIPKAYVELDGERLRRRFAVLARQLGRDSAVRIFA